MAPSQTDPSSPASKAKSSGRRSTRTSKKDIIKPTTPHLRRGKACMNCRFLKIKCDGIKPVCGPCTRVVKDDACEYTDGPSRTVRLEQTITELQARIRELEGMRANSTASLLFLAESSPTTHPPSIGTPSPDLSGFVGSNSAGSSLLGTPFADLWTLPPFEAYEQSSLLQAPVDLTAMQEPSLSEHQTLLDTFLLHSSQFGFFLHSKRFRSSVLSNPLGDVERPSLALMNSVYLWGVHLMQNRNAMWTSYESVFLRRALRDVSQEISSTRECSQMMETIQAQVLLANYFLRNGKFMEAEFHASGAVSLVLSYGLHQIQVPTSGVSPDSDSSSSGSTILGVSSGYDSLDDSVREVFPGPCRTVLEERERINGFWTVFCLQRTVMMTLRAPSKAFGTLECCNEIMTLWPLDIEDSDCEVAYSPGGVGWESIHDSTAALYVKAAVLVYRAVHLCYILETVVSSHERNDFMKECVTLDRLILQFQSSLPELPLEVHTEFTHTILPMKDSMKRTTKRVKLMLIHALTFCAYMKVQTAFTTCGVETARQHCVNAALSMFWTVRSVYLTEDTFLDPLVGTITFLATKALVDEMRKVNAGDSMGMDSLGWMADAQVTGVTLPGAGGIAEFAGERPAGFNGDFEVNSKAQLSMVLEEGIATMSLLANVCPLMRYQLRKIQAMWA